MSKILIAGLEQGAKRLKQILSKSHELEFADTIESVLSQVKAKHFDLLIVGVLFDQSRILELLYTAETIPELANTPLIGFAEQDSSLSTSAREAIEAVLCSIGGVDYLDTRDMIDSEIFDRIQSALSDASDVVAKRMRQSVKRWTGIINQAAAQKPHPVLFISGDGALAEKIQQHVKSLSGVRISMSQKSSLSEGFAAMATGDYSAMVCDLTSLSTDDALNAMHLFSLQIPIVALTSAEHPIEEAPHGSMIEAVSRSESAGFKIALAILSALGKTEALIDTRESRFSKFLLERLQIGLRALDAHADLKDVLHEFCISLEAHGRRDLNDDFFVSVLLRDRNGKVLRSGAAPSLPEEYNTAIDGVPIGPGSGSCGTSAFLSRPVYVIDIDLDPKWKNFLHLTQPHNLRACWSVPIIDDDGNVLATFAIYHKMPREPKDSELQLIGAAAEILKTLLVCAKDREYSLTVA